jgi:hypothetical protein
MQKNRLLYISILIILVALSTAFYVSKRGTLRTHQKCPDDYAKTDAGMVEYKKDMDKWTNAFFDTSPGATLSDWSKARYQFWVDNNCAAAIQRYKEGLDGKDPDKMKLIEDTIQKEIIRTN